MKILIVDDSKAMRMIIQRTMKKCDIGDFTTVEAVDGKDGLAKVEECGPDFILSDWNMPEMNGLEFLKALRASGNQTPFGFITTECTNDVRESAKEAGAAFFMTKPFSPENFEAEFSAILNA